MYNIYELNEPNNDDTEDITTPAPNFIVLEQIELYDPDIEKNIE